MCWKLAFCLQQKPNKKSIEAQEMPTEKNEPSKAPMGVITENAKDDDDEQIIIDKNALPTADTKNKQNPQQKGQLVDKLMQNRDEVVQKKQSDTDISQSPDDDTGIKKSAGIILRTAVKTKEKESSQNELQKLRQAIQAVCRSTNPLGKTMDYIQEDLDSMIRELEFWQKETQVQKQKMNEEQQKTEQELKTAQGQLLEVDQQIQDKIEKINSVKSSILHQDMILENLLRNVVDVNQS